MTPTAANTVFLEHFDHLLATPDSVGRLNQAILDLAVRGKLVPQDPADEPASELLKRIQAEKARLVEEGEIAKSKPLPQIHAEEIPFDLPKGWKWVRLEDIAQKLGAGSTPLGGKQVYEDTGVKFIRSQNVWNDGLRLDDVAYISEQINEKMSGSIVRAKDILLNITGASIARSALVPDGFDIGNVNQHVAIVRMIEPEIRGFIHTCIISSYIYNLIMSVQVGVSREGLSMSRLCKFVLPLPPLAEQHRIVARVEQLFAQTRRLAELLSKAQADLTHLNEAALHHLLAADTPADFNARWDFIAAHFDLLYSEPEHIAPLRQAILELAVRGKLTRQDSNDEPASELIKRIQIEKARLVEEGEIAKSKPLPPVHDDEKSIALPEGWEWARLDSILIALQTGPFGSNLHKSDYVAGGIPIVNPSNMQDGRIVANPDMTISEETRQRLSQYTLRVGDVVVARRGEMGRCALVTEKEADWLCGTGSLRMQLSNHLLKDYILRLFQTELARSHLVEGSVGITMSNLGQDTLLRLPIALPPLAEQQRIVARVEQLLGTCDALAAKLQAAQVERERLVAAVVAGVATLVGAKHSLID